MSHSEHLNIPNATAAQIEAEVGVDLVPGTEVMAEVRGARFYHSSRGQDATVLVPQPSDDRHDPLVSLPCSAEKCPHQS